MTYKTWTDEELRLAIQTSHTKSEVIEKLRLSHSSGNYQTIDRYIKKFNISIEHFNARTFGRNKSPSSISEIFIENSNFANSGSLKKKLIKHFSFQERCSICHITSWQGQKLKLHLDHINGNHQDNRVENLRFLCPNCHSLTSTYCRGQKIKRQHTCTLCNRIISKPGNCRTCAGQLRQNKNNKINWPNITELLQLVAKFGYVGAGKQLGVSDNAVRKRIKQH